MNSRLIAFIFSVFVWYSASVALAQEDGAPPAGDTAEVTSYDFEDDLVTGDLVRPDGEMLVVRRGGRRSSLIQIRENFIPELLQSVDEI